MRSAKEFHAAGLEERGIPASRGDKWSAVQVARLLEAAGVPFDGATRWYSAASLRYSHCDARMRKLLRGAAKPTSGLMSVHSGEAAINIALR